MEKERISPRDLLTDLSQVSSRYYQTAVDGVEPDERHGVLAFNREEDLMIAWLDLKRQSERTEKR